MSPALPVGWLVRARRSNLCRRDPGALKNGVDTCSGQRSGRRAGKVGGVCAKYVQGRSVETAGRCAQEEQYESHDKHHESPFTTSI